MVIHLTDDYEYPINKKTMFAAPSSLTNNASEYEVVNQNISIKYRTFKYRLLPTKKQHSVLFAICESQRQLYNAALQERIDCYKKTGKGRSYFYQCKGVT